MILFFDLKITELNTRLRYLCKLFLVDIVKLCRLINIKQKRLKGKKRLKGINGLKENNIKKGKQKRKKNQTNVLRKRKLKPKKESDQTLETISITRAIMKMRNHVPHMFAMILKFQNR